uniref:Uncharacterized protein n=1 Tax=Anopheles atroparvus TaxID=41427 RepID=A0A182J192_ANOAO
MPVDRRNATLGRADWSAGIILALHNSPSASPAGTNTPTTNTASIGQRKANNTGTLRHLPFAAVDHHRTAGPGATANDTHAVQYNEIAAIGTAGAGTTSGRFLADCDAIAFYNNISQGTTTAATIAATPATLRSGDDPHPGPIAHRGRFHLLAVRRRFSVDRQHLPRGRLMLLLLLLVMVVSGLGRHHRRRPGGRGSVPYTRTEPDGMAMRTNDSVADGNDGADGQISEQTGGPRYGADHYPDFTTLRHRRNRRVTAKKQPLAPVRPSDLSSGASKSEFKFCELPIIAALKMPSPARAEVVSRRNF